MSELPQVSNPEPAADPLAPDEPVTTPIVPSLDQQVATPDALSSLTAEIAEEAIAPADGVTQPSEPPPSYVKLAMRNMVKKRGTSIKHFVMTTAGLLALLLGLAYVTR